MFTLLEAAVIKLLLIPLKCIPVNDLLNNTFGPVIGKAAGAVGGILFGFAVLVTVVAGVAALAMALSKNAKQWILNVFKPSATLVSIIIAIACIITIIGIVDRIACG